MSVKNWCFTINNYTDEDIAKLDAFDCNYIVYGKEVGDSGTPHLQGYVQLNSKQRMSWLKKRLSATAHYEPSMGTPKQASDYCKKDGDFVESGEMSYQGRRSDIWSFTTRAKEEKERLSRRTLIEEFPQVYAKYPRFVQEVQSEYFPPSSRDILDNRWYYGESGTGKSSTARKEYPHAYIKAPNKWWDNYNGEEAVIIEDLDPDHAYMAYNLKIWADHYPYPAEIKGGKIEIRPKIIIVTSQYLPSQIFNRPEDIQAIDRRFKMQKFEK